MNETTTALIQSAIAMFGAPVISKIVTAIKETGKVDSKYLPFVSMGIGAIIGLVCSFIFGITLTNIVIGLLLGITSGAAGTGAYEAKKNLTISE